MYKMYVEYRNKGEIDMAKLKNIDTIWIAPSGTPVTVGNNRTITRNDYNALSGADSVDLPPTFECRSAKLKM